MSRDCKTWSFHDLRHPAPPGSPFERGNPPRVSCIRCGEHRLQTKLEADVRIKHQRRCIDREQCATKPAERTHSVWGDLATGAGLLAPDSYSEPETTDLQLGPMTRGDHLAKWLLVSLVVCVAGACAVIVATLPN